MKEMYNVRTVLDPTNDKNYFIFGSANNQQCWKYDCHKQKYIELKYNIPKHKDQTHVYCHECAYFEIKNKKNDCDKYALLYGGGFFETWGACYHIYEFNNEKWNENAMKLNDKWFDNESILQGEHSKYGFGEGLSMITDIFEKNKIHIMGGLGDSHKYGCFEFNHQILLNDKLGIKYSIECVCFFLYQKNIQNKICTNSYFQKKLRF